MRHSPPTYFIIGLLLRHLQLFIEAKLAATNALIASLPEANRKEDEITKKMALEVKVRKINESGSKTGTVALIEQEYDADLLERQIAGINDFVTVVTARKAAL